MAIFCATKYIIGSNVSDIIKPLMDNRPIGILDSGIGGLTVARKIAEKLPNESLVYIGDTARVPYGTRGKEIITEFSLELVKFLLTQKVKIVVVACNTISATCLDKINAVSPVPILDVITPAVEKIVDLTKTNSVGIIGTKATINSRLYEEKLRKLSPQIKVLAKACPLFVPIVEEGFAKSKIALLAAKEYLQMFNNANIDVLHLGCTHYPLLRTVIQKVLKPGTKIVDSAKPTAEALKKFLLQSGLSNNGYLKKDHKIFVTDSPQKARESAKIFFGRDGFNKIQKVSLR